MNNFKNMVVYVWSLHNYSNTPFGIIKINWTGIVGWSAQKEKTTLQNSLNSYYVINVLRYGLFFFNC